MLATMFCTSSLDTQIIPQSFMNGKQLSNFLQIINISTAQAISGARERDSVHTARSGRPERAARLSESGTGGSDVVYHPAHAPRDALRLYCFHRTHDITEPLGLRKPLLGFSVDDSSQGIRRILICIAEVSQSRHTQHLCVIVSALSPPVLVHGYRYKQRGAEFLRGKRK